MISSYCRIDCSICDQFIDRQCPSCFKVAEKRRCRIPECVTGRNVETCLKCIRVDYCKKRRNAIRECLVFLPRRDISARKPYLIDEAGRDEAFNIFFRDVYDGADGLIVNFDGVEGKWEQMLEDVKRIEGEYALEKIQNKVIAFIEKNHNPVILINNLRILKEKNFLPNILEFLNITSEKASTKGGAVFIINDLEKEDRDRIVDYMADKLVEAMLKAVSNPQRKDILKLLGRKGKSSFRELIDEFDYYIPSKLSFHLKLLKDTGILEQDDGGIYYISPTGREFNKLIDSMTSLSASKVRLRPTSETKPVPDHRREGYKRYLRAAKKSGNFQFVNLIKDMEESLGTYYGKTQTEGVILTTLGDYIESERVIDKNGLKRLVSEIVFVHLVDTMPLEKAISWADEMTEEHGLN